MISRELSKFIRDLSYDKLPSDIQKLAKVCLLDYLACTLAGSRSEIRPIFESLIEDAGGTPQATVIGSGTKTSLSNAVLINGAYSHVLELDDIHRLAMYHPGIVVLPTALAIAENEHLSGKALMEAIVTGYEIGIRIGVAVNPSHFRYWHTTGTVGSFASSATAGKLMDLSEDEMVWALGNAGTQASGLWQFNIDGAMTKPLHAGKACMNGLLAAMLAKRGFTGAENIIEGHKGFCVATSEAVNYDFVLHNLGRVFECSGIGVKVHSGCRHTSSPVDGALALRKEHAVKAEDIEEITIRTYALGKDLCGSMSPKNISEAKFSIAYCVCCALAFGHCNIGEMQMNVIHSNQIKDLLSRTSLVVDEELEKRFSMGYGSIVAVTLKNGESFSVLTEHAKGDPENPASLEEMQTKFRLLSDNIIPPEKQEKTIELVERLEDLDDICQLLPYLSP
jgi:2-methylcitrate dehydratase PrpD